MVSMRIQKREDNRGVAEYEQSREERIKQNLQRMQSLGILELSRNLKPPPKPKTVGPQKPSLSLSGSPRRSSRIKVLPHVSYSEKHLAKAKVVTAPNVIRMCHQCRKKMAGLRTKCCKCTSLQGQFCGKCLFRRYGENILEANANLGWICPVCRDICNCFNCRRLKGLEPTGNLYEKALCLGYQSVAHYLIHTESKKT